MSLIALAYRESENNLNIVTFSAPLIELNENGLNFEQ